MVDQALADIGGLLGLRDKTVSAWETHRDDIVGQLQDRYERNIGTVDEWFNEAQLDQRDFFAGLESDVTNAMLNRGISGTVAANLGRGVQVDRQEARDKLAGDVARTRTQLDADLSGDRIAYEDAIGQSIMNLDRQLNADILNYIDTATRAGQAQDIGLMGDFFNQRRNLMANQDAFQLDMAGLLINTLADVENAPPDLAGLAQREANRADTIAANNYYDQMNQPWYQQVFPAFAQAGAATAAGTLGGTLGMAVAGPAVAGINAANQALFPSIYGNLGSQPFFGGSGLTPANPNYNYFYNAAMNPYSF